MSDIFDNPARFIVYHHGFSGSFLTRLICGISTNNYQDIQIAEAGHCHDYATRRDGGMVELNPPEIRNPLWHCMTFDQRLEILRNDVINSSSRNFGKFRVIQSHQPSHIPLYRAIFPACKILGVTYNAEDSIAGTVNGFIKFTLELYGDTRDERRLPKIKLAQTYLMDKFKVFMPFVAPTAANSQNAHTLLLWALLRCEINPHDAPIETFVGRNKFDLSEYPGLIEFPYSIIRHGDAPKLVSKIQELFDSPLSDIIIQFLTHNFLMYYEKQNNLLMTDPRRFLLDLESRALTILDDMKISATDRMTYNPLQQNKPIIKGEVK